MDFGLGTVLARLRLWFRANQAIEQRPSQVIGFRGYRRRRKGVSIASASVCV